MSKLAIRRTYRRLGAVVGSLGLLVVGDSLGVAGDEAFNLAGVLGGAAMIGFGVWSVVRSRRVGASRR